jgi:hypothetical protein
MMSGIVVTPEGFSVTTEIRVTRQRIADVLCSAFESGHYGSGYWASIEARYAPETAAPHDKNEGWYMVDGEGYPSYASLPLLGGNVTVKDHEDEDGAQYLLDEAAIKRGLSVLAIKHLNDILEENDDGDTADNFLQCCLFGEVIYG